jgi:hypothetical protein
MRNESLFEAELENKLLEMIAEMRRLSENIDAYIKRTECLFSTLTDMTSKGDDPGVPPDVEGR